MQGGALRPWRVTSGSQECGTAPGMRRPRRWRWFGAPASRPGSGASRRSETERQTQAMTAVAEKTASGVRPFTIRVPEADLEDLRARVTATRWPDKETVDDASQGPQLATMRALADYWATEYDWRRCEARLNSFPQFLTRIDGLDIHFLHVRSKHEDALPLIVCHGWPGSIIEQLKIVHLLTDPPPHGASAWDAFPLGIPNMPGYGFSGKPATTGWDPIRMGRAYVVLMKRLGYER